MWGGLSEKSSTGEIEFIVAMIVVQRVKKSK